MAKSYLILQREHLDLNGDNAVDYQDAAAALALRASATPAKSNKNLQCTAEQKAPWSKDRRERDVAIWSTISSASQGKFPLECLSKPQLQRVVSAAGFAQRLIQTKPLSYSPGPAHVAPTKTSESSSTLAAMRAQNIQPIFATDLDNTAWHGDIGIRFVHFMSADLKRIRPQAKQALAKILSDVAKKHPDSVARHLGLRPGADNESIEDTIQTRTAVQLTETLGKLEKQPRADSPTGTVIGGYELFVMGAAMSAGYSATELHAIGARLMEVGDVDAGLEPWKSHFYSDKLDTYVQLQDQGIEGWAISAGYDFLATAGAVAVGLDRDKVRASTVEYDAQGFSTGKVGKRIYPLKDEVLLSVMEQRNALTVAAFGDSVSSDIPMLNIVDFTGRILGSGDSSSDSSSANPEQSAGFAQFSATARRPGSQNSRWVSDFNNRHGTHLQSHTPVH